MKIENLLNLIGFRQKRNKNILYLQWDGKFYLFFTSRRKCSFPSIRVSRDKNQTKNGELKTRIRNGRKLFLSTFNIVVGETKEKRFSLNFLPRKYIAFHFRNPVSIGKHCSLIKSICRKQLISKRFRWRGNLMVSNEAPIRFVGACVLGKKLCSNSTKANKSFQFVNKRIDIILFVL